MTASYFRSERVISWAPSALMIFATVFNAILAVVNAKFAKLSPNVVIGTEIIITLASYAFALRYFRPEMRIWWILLGVILVLFCLESTARGDIQVKYLRDVLIIPTFILLGMTSQREKLDTTVCILHAIVISFGIYEALDTDGYAKLFDVQSYYVNTRGYEEDNFWNKQSDLFVSAVRPGDRAILPFLNLHRLSSIFLEPVSAGNYCTIITAYICARFFQLGVATRWFLIIGNAMVLIGCDGRLAGLSAVLIIAVTFVAPRTPRGTAFIYLPLTILFAFVLTQTLGLTAGPDDISGRIAHTVQLLTEYDVQDLFALSDRFIWRAADSGVAYLIMTQTIYGFFLIWIFVIFGANENRGDQVRFTHAIIVYLSLAMMVSFSILTIKTAALMWFIQGSLQRNERARSPSAVRAQINPVASTGRSISVGEGL
jgi:putative polymerase